MRKLLLICLFLLSMVVHAQETLTNQSIIDMVEIGFESELIIEKINSSTCAFQTGIEELKLLKDKGVSTSILTAMVKASKPEQVKVRTGIFVMIDSVEVQLLPTVFSGSKTNTLASVFSYGIASAKVKSTIGGVKSPNLVPQSACQFIFYFDPNKDDNFGQNDWWFRAATSPNEFALARFKVNEKKNYRELEVGSINQWSGKNTGVVEELICSVEIEQRGGGVYIVTPTEQLEPGEYCFYYKGFVPQGGYNNQSAFDFSVVGSTESSAADGIASTVAFVPVVGYVTRGERVDGLPLQEGLIYVGDIGGWNGTKYTKGLYVEPRNIPKDAMGDKDKGSEICAAKGMILPSRDQLRRMVTHKSIVSNSQYGFVESYYWSSTGFDQEDGWCVKVPSGEFKMLSKGVAAYVRCVKEY